MLDVGPIMLCNRAGGREAVASLILKNQEKGMAWGHSSWVGGVCPGMLHKLSSHFACMACAESRLECRPNTPPPLFLYLSLSLFVTNITARQRFGKQRECVTLVVSLCFGSLNPTKKIKNSSRACGALYEGCVHSAFINKIFMLRPYL